MARFEEAIRIVLESEGEADVAKLSKALEGAGDVSEEAKKQFLALATAMSEATSTERQIAAHKALEERFVKSAIETRELREEVDKLGAAFIANENPSKRQTAELQRKTDALTKLEARQSQYGAELRRSSTTLKTAGVDTARLTSEEQRLAQGKTQLLQRIQQMGRAVGEQSAKQRQANTDLRDSASAARSADGAFSGVINRLKGLAAAAIAYVSINKLKEGLLGILSIGDRFDKLEQRFTQAFGGIDAGATAMGKLRDLAKDTPQTFNEVADAALKLKTFGLDPLDGSLQALIDQNAALGGSNETLQGLILATGQAWAKQKLQGEEILQLVERGVPVWDLLSKATGKNVTELQKLSEQGKLGRDVMAALITEIGKANQGAAAQGVGLLSGAVAKLRDQVEQFFDRVADSGPMQFFRGQIESLTAKIRELADSGELDQIARKVGQGIVDAATAIKNGVAAVAQYSSAIMLLGKAFVAAKIATFAGDLIATARGWKVFADGAKAGDAAAAAATGTMGKLRTAIGRIPTAIKIGIAVAGYELLERAGTAIGEFIGKNSAAAAELEATTSRAREQLRLQAVDALSAANALGQYKDTQIQAAAEIAAANEAERAAYHANLQALQQYLQARLAYLIRQKEIGLATKEEAEELGKLPARLAEVRSGFVAMGDGIKLAERALKDGIDPAILAIRENLEKVSGSAKDAGKFLTDTFKDRDFAKTSVEVGNIAVAIAQVSGESSIAERAIRDGLSGALEKLSGRDLLAFQSAATAAFDEVGAKAGNTGLVLQETLRAAMSQLGVSAQAAGKTVTAEGANIIASFNAVAENAQASADQIELAFRAALQKVSTSGEAEQLSNSLKAAAEQGRIGFETAERAAAQLRRRIDEIKAAADPLADSFSQLGIKSQAEMRRAAEAAREAYQAIVQGAKQGEAAQEDVRRAFEAYAEAARAAVADSTEGAQKQLESQLQAQAAALGLRDVLIATGEAGKDAGDKTAQGFANAKDKVDDLKAAAGGVNTTLAQTPIVAGQAAAGIGQVAESVGVLNEQQTKAMNLLTQFARQGSDITQIGVANARFILDQVGSMIGSTSQVLQNLITQADASAQRAMQTAQSVQDMTRQLEESVLNLSGDQEAIEQRRMQSQMERIDLLEREAKAAGEFDALRFARLRELAQKEHLIRMEQLKEQARVERETDSGGSSGGTGTAGSSKGGGQVITHRIEMPVGDKTYAFNVGNANDASVAQQMLQEIMRAARAGGFGGGRFR